MKNTPLMFGIAAASILIVGGFLLLSANSDGSRDTYSFFVPQVTFNDAESGNPSQLSEQKIPGTSASLTVTPGVERWFTNDARTFSFRLPDGFSAPPFNTGVPGVDGTVLQAPGREPLVILEYRVAPMSQLTLSNVRESLAGAQLYDPREIIVHAVVRGLAFKTDDGIEVWMIHNGHLYRLLTAESNEDLVTFVLSNWYFAPPFPSMPK